MYSSDKLRQYLSVYLSEKSETNIQHVALRVPGHEGHFLIKDSFFITSNIIGRFDLIVIFTLYPNTAQGTALLDKINRIGCFDGFTKKEGPIRVVFTKETGNDITNIVGIVEKIIATLFSGIHLSAIDLDLVRRIELDPDSLI